MQDNMVEFLKGLGKEDLSFILNRMDAGPGEKQSRCRFGEEGGRRGKAPCPAKTFDVPADVKHLDQTQMGELTANFRQWFESAPTPSRKRSRGRIWLLYLLIRYGALKLGEAITVDDRMDIDFTQSSVTVSGDHSRQVKLPKEVSREVAKLLDHPMNASLRGEVLRLDQGFVRRKFYERADACRIPRELANPTVIRHSRAVELLREGLPLKVVQSVLGHQSANLTAQYVNFSEDDIKRIVNFYILKEASMKTSARNAFTGKVTAIRDGNILSEVEVTTPGGLKVVSVITHESMGSLGIGMGSLVTATVKAPWVILVKEEMKLRTSARNKYCGKIVKVNEGVISAEVVVELPDGTRICSLVTDESVKNLDLKVGDEICTMFKAFSVILNVE